MKWANENTKTTGIFNDMRKEIEKSIVKAKDGVVELSGIIDGLSDINELKLVAKTYDAFISQVTSNITMYLLVMQCTSRTAEIPKEVQEAIVDFQVNSDKIAKACCEKAKATLKTEIEKFGDEETIAAMKEMLKSIGDFANEVKEAKKNE